jgi:prevent-host-death family protein
MTEIMTITEAKARLSELVGRLIHRKDRIFITKKGKRVAVLLPIGTYESLAEKGAKTLSSAGGALADLDAEIVKMCADIYAEREKEKGREVAF